MHKWLRFIYFFRLAITTFYRKLVSLQNKDTTKKWNTEE